MAARGRPSPQRNRTPASSKGAGVLATGGGTGGILAVSPETAARKTLYTEDLEPPDDPTPARPAVHRRAAVRRRMPVRRNPPKTGKSPTGKKVPGRRHRNPLGRAKRPATGNPAFDAAIMSMASYLRYAQYGVSEFLAVYRGLHDVKDRLGRWAETTERKADRASHKGTRRRLERLAGRFAEAADRMAVAYRKAEQSQDDLEYLIDGGIAVVQRLMESQDTRAIQQAKRLSGQIDVVEDALNLPGQQIGKALSILRSIKPEGNMRPKSVVAAAVKVSDRVAKATGDFYEMLGMLDDAVVDMSEAVGGWPG